MAPERTKQKTKLTKRTVESIAPGKKDKKVWDAEIPGFGVKVTPKGRRVYVLQYWAPSQVGVRRTYTLGVHGSPVKRVRNGVEETRSLTTELARELAREARADVQRGQDPAGAKGAARLATKTLTLSVLSARYLKECESNVEPSTHREYRNIFTAQLIPELGRMVVATISYNHISALHQKLKATPVHANRVVAVLSAFLTWCMTNSFRPLELNPCTKIKKFKEHSRERYLTPEEFARVGAAFATAESVGLPKAPEYVEYEKRRKLKKPVKPENQKHRTKASLIPRVADPFGVAAIRLLLLTGWRSTEVFSLQWKIVDLNAGVVGLPDTKTGKSNRSIGHDAIELLRGLARIEGSPYVFPSQRAKWQKPIKSLQRLWYAVRAAAKLPGVRLHDLRHSFASVSVQKGESLFITGKLLGHRHAATTERYAHLSRPVEKRAADEVSRIIAVALARDVPHTKKSGAKKKSGRAKGRPNRAAKVSRGPAKHAKGGTKARRSTRGNSRN